jgi:hypothetical protein
MNRKTFGIGLLLVVASCGHGMDAEPSPTEQTSSVVQAAAPTKPIDELPKGCMNDRYGNEPTPPPPAAPIDDQYRKNGAESEARKMAAWEKAERENPTLNRQLVASETPPDSKLLDRQAQYLKALQDLEVKHRHQYGPAYERERVALKERIFPED